MSGFIKKAAGWLALLAPIVFVLFPGISEAAVTIRPANGDTAWPLYVMGQGDAIFHILQAVKGMMSDSGFGQLLGFIAMLSVAVLAVIAGFNPSQHAYRFITFFIVTWLLLFVGKNLVADVAVHDPGTNYYNVVSDVPALVALPASAVSTVGQWMDSKITQYYSLPAGLDTAKGTFNLPAKIMADQTTFQIMNMELKRSLSSFMADCVVPAMGQGRMTLSQLMNSTNMLSTLQAAKFNAILTKSFVSPDGLSPIPSSGASNELIGLGNLISCSEAYDRISAGLVADSEAVLNSATASWGKSGIMTPFNDVLSGALTWLQAGSLEPNSYVQQKGLIAQFNHSFKDAAAQAGNSELMMSLQGIQAAESQKSSWVMAAQVFNNMMGYVYVTLQAFIFAMVPVVLIALMVPGFGKSMMANYFQVMLWLAMWQPLLGIVNFLILLFSKNTIGGELAQSGGFTLGNSPVVTDAANNMVVAAQFLGTMVPLISWGLVKGAIAFSEFISHGMGSSIGSGAGVAASTGSINLNQQSIDNQSMGSHKFTSQWSTGFGDIQSHLGVGSMNPVYNRGGTSGTAAGGGLGMSEKMGESGGLSREASSGKTARSGINAAAGASYGVSGGTQQQYILFDAKHIDTHGLNQAAGKSGTSSESLNRNMSTEEGFSGGIGYNVKANNSASASAQGGIGTTPADKGAMGGVAGAAAAGVAGAAGAAVASAPAAGSPGTVGGKSKSLLGKMGLKNNGMGVPLQRTASEGTEVKATGDHTKRTSLQDAYATGKSVQDTGSRGESSSQMNSRTLGGSKTRNGSETRGTSDSVTASSGIESSQGVTTSAKSGSDWGFSWNRNAPYDPLAEEMAWRAQAVMGAAGAAQFMQNLGAVSGGTHSAFESAWSNMRQQGSDAYASAAAGAQAAASPLLTAAGQVTDTSLIGGTAGAISSGQAGVSTEATGIQQSFNSTLGRADQVANSLNPIGESLKPNVAAAPGSVQTSYFGAGVGGGALLSGVGDMFSHLRGGGGGGMAAASGTAAGAPATAATGAGGMGTGIFSAGAAGGAAAGVFGLGMAATAAGGLTAFRNIGIPELGMEGDPNAGAGIVNFAHGFSGIGPSVNAVPLSRQAQ